uniref:Uncharacterized protein n=1 Tax=Arundo donax TaxID=35708 RepID=A0A0A9BW59_ARUDO
MQNSYLAKELRC